MSARPRPAWVPDDLYPFADRYADVAAAAFDPTA